MARSTRSFLAAGALAPVLGYGLVVACNPIFGIVSRTAGPTWCEQDAEALTNGYCADFDRGDAAPATSQDLAANVNAAVEVANDEASSAPNSLKVVSSAVGADAGVLAGFLIPFGQGVAPGAELPRFMCQADILGEDVMNATAAGVSVGVLAVGGQASECAREPVLAVVGFDAKGLALSLQRFAGPTVPAAPIGVPVTARLPVGIPGSGWSTLKIMVVPASADSDAGSLASSLVGDGGVTRLRGCTLAAHAAEYVVIVEIGGIYAASVRIPDLGFDVATMAYGAFITGPAPAVTVHIDNVRCASMPSSG